MSEADRSRLYNWMRANADETTAEYLMSCLPSAPLPDLATKDFVTAELSKFATKEDLAAGFAQAAEERAAGFAAAEEKRAAGFEHAAKERAAGFAAAEEKRAAGFEHAAKERAAGFAAAEEKRAAGFEHAAKERAAGFAAAEEKRAADRAVADKRHNRMRAAAVLIAVEIAAAEAGWLRWLNDIAASPF